MRYAESYHTTPRNSARSLVSDPHIPKVDPSRVTHRISFVPLVLGGGPGTDPVYVDGEENALGTDPDP